jgi:tetratricopeptide (TPR) repeat protein
MPSIVHQLDYLKDLNERVAGLVNKAKLQEAKLPMEEALGLSAQLNNSHERIRALHHQAMWHYKSNHYLQAKPIAEQIFAMSKQTYNLPYLTRSLHLLSTIHHELTEREKAYEYYLQGINYGIELNDPHQLSTLYSLGGMLLRDWSKPN